MTQCETCLWYGKCWSTSLCDDYSPIELDYDQIIEARKEDFQTEWFEYIKDQ